MILHRGEQWGECIEDSYTLTSTRRKRTPDTFYTYSTGADPHRTPLSPANLIKWATQPRSGDPGQCPRPPGYPTLTRKPARILPRNSPFARKPTAEAVDLGKGRLRFRDCTNAVGVAYSHTYRNSQTIARLRLELFDQFDLSWPPSLVKPRIKWSIETEDSKPSLIGHTLDPIGLLTLRCRRTEVESD